MGQGGELWTFLYSFEPGCTHGPLEGAKPQLEMLMAGLRGLWMVPLALVTGGAGLALGVRYHAEVIRGLGGTPAVAQVAAGPATAEAPASATGAGAATTPAVEDIVKYTCGMHPQII